MLWVSNKWKKGDALDAATAVYLETRRNAKVVQIVFKLEDDSGDVFLSPRGLEFKEHVQDLSRIENAKSNFVRISRSVPAKLSKAKISRRCTSQHSYIEPVVRQGLFSMPVNALTGVEAVDDKNLCLVDGYTAISKILKSAELEGAMSGILKADTSGSVKQKISRIRTACFLLRQEIMLLGGVPLAEPIEYWRFKFSSVSF